MNRRLGSCMNRRMNLGRLGLVMGVALAAGCSSGPPDGTASNGTGGDTATNGGSTAGPLAAGAVTTLSGQGGQGPGYTDGSGFGDGGARFNRPVALAVDSSGTVYVADTGNNCVRQIDASGNTTTVSSSLAVSGPSGVAVDPAGDLIVSGGRDYHIWKLPTDGSLQILAGGAGANISAYVNGVGGQGGAARFVAPAGVALDSQGNVYVADFNYIRKIDAQLNVTTVAGIAADAGQGLVDGSGGENGTAQFSLPRGLAVDGAGNIFVADTSNNAIRKIDTSGNVTTVAGTTDTGLIDGSGGPNGPARFNRPTGVAVDQYGNLFVTDSGNNVIRHIDPTGMVSTWAGTGASSFGDSPSPLEASFATPFGIALRAGDGLAVADQVNNCVRLIAP